MPPYWDRIPLPAFYNKFVCSVFPVKACLLFVGMNKKTTFTPFEPRKSQKTPTTRHNILMRHCSPVNFEQLTKTKNKWGRNGICTCIRLIRRGVNAAINELDAWE